MLLIDPSGRMFSFAKISFWLSFWRKDHIRFRQCFRNLHRVTRYSIFSITMGKNKPKPMNANDFSEIIFKCRFGGHSPIVSFSTPQTMNEMIVYTTEKR